MALNKLVGALENPFGTLGCGSGHYVVHNVCGDQRGPLNAWLFLLHFSGTGPFDGGGGVGYWVCAGMCLYWHAGGMGI